MKITKELIMTLQGIKNFGPRTIQTICAEAERLGRNVSSLVDLYELCRWLSDTKVLRRVASLSLEDFNRAYSFAQNTLETSLSMGIKVASRYDACYPKQFLSTVDEFGKPAAPILIYYKGDIEVADKAGIAIIGTRKPTHDGVCAGQYYAEAFASIGANVISGLALGCDTAAHRGALNVGGTTTAILANGLDSIYPSENAFLAEEILSNGGLLISENPIGTRANKYNLIARDRLQVGLAKATLVVQSSVKGGTMHAVNATLKARKPLYAITYKFEQGIVGEGNLSLVTQKLAIPMRSSKEVILNSPGLFLPVSKDNSETERSAQQLYLFSGLEV